MDNFRGDLTDTSAIKEALVISGFAFKFNKVSLGYLIQ